MFFLLLADNPTALHFSNRQYEQDLRSSKIITVSQLINEKAEY
jgi:hypothetical protein